MKRLTEKAFPLSFFFVFCVFLCNRFLALAGNKIRKVENLQCLNKLQFLDLSGNAIDDFDAG